MGDGWSHGKPVLRAVIVSALIGALGAGPVGCGDTDERSTTTADATAMSTPATDAPVVDTSSCKHVKPSKVKPAAYKTPVQTVRKGEKLTAIVETSCGTFEIELDTKRSPTTVNSFVFLAEKGFYDGLEFDQAAPGTYLHGGDPPGDAVGPGYSVQGEVPRSIVYRHRIVAMAQPFEAPAGTAGSQFFIVLAKPWIDASGTYPPLGTVSKGLEALRRINALGPRDMYAGESNVGVIGVVEELRRTVLIEKISIEKG